MRKIAREIVFSLIFEYTFLKEQNAFGDGQSVFENKDIDNDDIEYIKETYFGIVKNFDNLKNDISKYLKDYSIERLYRIDLSVLLLAFYEIKFSDAPNAVVIDEAVRLAKAYSTPNSTSYVNGVLAELVRR